MINRKLSLPLVLSLVLLSPTISSAQESQGPSKNIINAKVIEGIKSFVNTDIVFMSVENQNTKYGNLSQAEIDDLDNEWKTENKSDDKPLISATLSNPLSSYLTRVQSGSAGLYTEIFVMDKNGLNVGQSSISSDYWQGDEAKFQKTYPVGVNAIFIDDPEYDEAKGTWASQVNMSVSNGDKLLGAITVEVNLTELQRRKNLGLF